jgi:mRNA-capping enzyme
MDCPYCVNVCVCSAAMPLYPANLDGRAPPEGWTASASLPQSVLAGRVVVIKTPLSGRSGWAPGDVTLAVRELTGVPPGLVLNLSNTAGYYDASEFECPVRWLRQRGGGALPTARQVRRFVRVCSQFLAGAQRGAGGALVVHCTHGQNRSGYFVAHLLMRRFGHTPQAALAAFAQARPPGILRLNYVTGIFGTAAAAAAAAGGASWAPTLAGFLQKLL